MSHNCVLYDVTYVPYVCTMLDYIVIVDVYIQVHHNLYNSIQYANKQIFLARDCICCTIQHNMYFIIILGLLIDQQIAAMNI